MIYHGEMIPVSTPDVTQGLKDARRTLRTNRFRPTGKRMNMIIDGCAGKTTLLLQIGRAYQGVLETERRPDDEWTPVSLCQLEVAGQRAGVTDPRAIRAGLGREPTEKIIRQRLISRFVRTSRARRRWVARAGSVRSLVRIRQFLRWAKPCSQLGLGNPGASTAGSRRPVLHSAEGCRHRLPSGGAGPDTER